jgi:hypothetical protein
MRHGLDDGGRRAAVAAQETLSPARTSSTKSISLGGAPAARNRFDRCVLLGTRGRPSAPNGRPHDSASSGQAHNQSWIS